MAPVTRTREPLGITVSVMVQLLSRYSVTVRLLDLTSEIAVCFYTDCARYHSPSTIRSHPIVDIDINLNNALPETNVEPRLIRLFSRTAPYRLWLDEPQLISFSALRYYSRSLSSAQTFVKPSQTIPLPPSSSSYLSPPLFYLQIKICKCPTLLPHMIVI